MKNVPWKEIFIVNLDSDKQRLENVSKQFNKIGMTLRKVSNTRERDWSEARATHKCRYYCDKGVIGSYYGHYKLWKKMVDENIESALIVEDDITLDEDFENKFDIYWRHVPEDWDMVLLGCIFQCKREKNFIDRCLKISYFENNNHPINDYINKITSFSGIHAYILNINMAKRLLAASEEIDNIIEVQLSRYLNKNRDLNVYAFEDYIITQNLILYESVNNISRIPNIINKPLDKIIIQDTNHYKVSLAYVINQGIYQYKIFGYILNVMIIILFLFGFALGLLLDWRYAVTISILFVIVDIIYTGLVLKTKVNLQMYVKFWLLLFISVLLGYGSRVLIGRYVSRK